MLRTMGSGAGRTAWLAGAALVAAAGVALGGSVLSAADNTTLTAVDGLRVGHYTLSDAPRGCTVVLVDGPGAAGGVSQRGAAPGTRETDLLDPLNLVDKVNAITLSGGSAFGLDAASGVMRWLDEHGTGWPTGTGPVPIVPAAVIYDLPVGNARIRPTADCGYRAASAATANPVEEGSVGAGAGATVGKLRGMGSAMHSGVGSAAIRLPSGLVVSALAVVNALGDVIDPATGKIVAGVRNADGTFADARLLLRAGRDERAPGPGENTTLVVVATNARLTKTEANRMALMADDGLARAIVPSHTMADGDTVFALATGRWDGTSDLTTIGALAADAAAQAIVRAATQAASLPGLPAARDLGR